MHGEINVFLNKEFRKMIVVELNAPVSLLQRELKFPCSELLSMKKRLEAHTRVAFNLPEERQIVDIWLSSDAQVENTMAHQLDADLLRLELGLNDLNIKSGERNDQAR